MTVYQTYAYALVTCFFALVVALAYLPLLALTPLMKGR